MGPLYPVPEAGFCFLIYFVILFPARTLKTKNKGEKMKEKRPSWDEYFMDIAELVSKRTTCLRRQVGAVAVKEKKILATGYNGAPRGIRHCSETGCLREKLGVPSGERHELCRGLHAEQNCIIQAASHGVELEGATIYVTNFPCITCAKMLINAGIKRLVYENPLKNPYADNLSVDILKESKMEMLELKKKKRRTK